MRVLAGIPNDLNNRHILYYVRSYSHDAVKGLRHASWVGTDFVEFGAPHIYAVATDNNQLKVR